MNTSILAEELAPLNAQIEQAREKLGKLEGELRLVDAELNTFSADRQRFDTLRDICNGLDKLGELEAAGLFWDGVAAAEDGAGQVRRLRERIAVFEEQIRGTLESREALMGRINQCLDELDDLDEEVRQAYGREERRQEEFVIEREISDLPYRAMSMPWSRGGQSEGLFRRSMLVSMLLSIVFGYLVPLVDLPLPDRAAAVLEIPERLAMLVKKEEPKPEPVRKRPQEEKKPLPEQGTKPKPEKPPERAIAEKEPPKPAAGEPAPAPRKKAENIGVLAFKSTFDDLMKETPIAKLGTESRLIHETPQAAGQAIAQRSLVAIQARGGSSGIGGVSRNIGSGNADRLGGGGGNGTGGSGIGFARVGSGIAGVAEESRPLSDGPGPGRTDEEIQIVFDRYKAALYRIYNTELRKNPTLRGKMLLRLTIEPGGEVSYCQVESTDLASPELVTLIVERVRKFNFGPKEEVPKTTILYPIDFLPAA